MRTLHILILVCALLEGKWTFGQHDELSCGISKPVEYLNIVGIRSFSDVVSRVAGTSETESVRPRTYPWLVSAGFLDNDGLWNHQCGGSIISNKHILTAAHCTMGPGKYETRTSEVVRQMRSLGVDTNQLVGNGWCPLSLASIYGNREVVEYLVEEASADVAAVDNFGQTPLLAAACSGYDDIVAFLVKKDRAQVNRRDAFEQTPLHLAAKFGRKEVVELLLKNGANKQARTSQGQNPRDLAIQFGHFDLDQLLS